MPSATLVMGTQPLRTPDRASNNKEAMWCWLDGYAERGMYFALSQKSNRDIACLGEFESNEKENVHELGKLF